MPMSPWTKWLIHVQYWDSNGRSVPSWCVSALTASGAASGPSTARAGSPGSTWPAKNTITLRIHSVIKASPTRLRMKMGMFRTGRRRSPAATTTCTPCSGRSR